MALYSSGTQIADVALTDTFNTWRTRFNSSISDAASTSANNVFVGQLNEFNALTQFANMSANTAAVVGLNVTNTFTAETGAFDGAVTAPIVTANSFVGPLTGTLQTAAQPNITSVGTLTGLTTTGNINLGDSDVINIGAGNDLQIQHNGTHSYISDAGTGNLYIQTSAGLIIENAGGSETMGSFTENGAVTLYYDNAAKLATKTDGVDITGELQSDSLDVDGNGDISGNLVVGGNLNVNGTTTTVATTNMVVSDNLIELNNGAGSNANDSGIIIERGSTGDNAFIGWDESADRFIVGTTTATGASTGNLTITKGTINADLAGTVTTAAQASITSLGTLTSLTMGGVLDTNGNNITLGGGDIDGEGGNYTNLHGTVGSSSTTINANVPVNKRTMAGAETFTFSNSAEGKATVLLLDTSASDHDPTWPSTFKWSDATEPTWDDYRYWVISIFCLDGTNQLCSATGHDT